MNQGFIQLLIIAVLLIIILSLLGVSLGAVFSNQTLRGNFKFVWDSTNYIWSTYLSWPAKIIWKIWMKYVWETFTEAIERIKENKNPLPPEVVPTQNNE